MRGRITVEAKASGEVRLRWRASEGVCAKGANPSLSIASNFKTRTYNLLQSGYGALPRTPSRYTPHARHVTREAVACLEEDYGENCWFVTLTLPGSTRAALCEFASWSSYIVARLHQWLRDNYGKVEFVTVWELQRRGALHLHMACAGGELGNLEAFKERMHHLWCHLLESTSERRGIDLFERSGGGTWRHRWDKVRTQVEKVKSSVSRYLSKYLSKEATKSWQPSSYSPVRWWSCSRTLRAKLQARRMTFTSATMLNTTCGEWFDTVAGTICGAAQAVFAIANAYRPQDRCLSVWFPSRELAQSVTWRAWSQVDSVANMCDSLSAHKDTSPLSRMGGAALCEDLDEIFREDLSKMKPPAAGWGLHRGLNQARAG